MNEMDEIVHEFLVESHENLDQLDRDLVALEQEPGSRPLLARVFRTIHTIKGTSGFLAYAKLEKVTHVGEGLLSMLRDGELALTPEITSGLLELVDAVRGLLATIEAAGGEGDVDHSVLIARLTALQSGEAPAPAGTAPAAELAGGPLIGETLVQHGVVGPDDVALAVLEQQVGDDRRLGEILVEHGAVSPRDLSEALDAHQDGRRSVADSSVRVDVDVLDTLMRLVGELVLTRNQLAGCIGEDAEPATVRTWQRLNVIADDLREGVMKARMQPIDSVWNRLPRVVRDLGHAVGKQVRLEMVGGDTELDRSVLEAVKDPLTHLVRNATDHGIETPTVRAQHGKAAEGRLVLRAYHDAGQVNLEISDDGAGIDPARIAATALDRGLVTSDQLARMSRREILNLVFLPGFSTATKVTNVSGRGVGMDVVKTNMERIGGSVDVQSEIGAGTTFRIRIPLTLAIISSLIVGVGDQRFAIPQVSLREIVRVEADERRTRIEHIFGAPVFRLRGRLLPLLWLRAALGLAEDTAADRSVHVVVLGSEDRQFGLVVDDVVDAEEIVVKPLSAQLKKIDGYAGAAILGDGRVALILDVWALADGHGATVATGAPRDATDEAAAARDGSDAGAHALLVVRLAGDRHLVIPMDRVTRLEDVPVRNIEQVGGREALQYRGGILPVARLSDLLDRSDGSDTGPTDGDSLRVVVYREGDRSIGLVVDDILDIVSDDAEAVRSSLTDIDGPGVVGTVVVQQRVMEMLDVRQAILAADPHFYDRSTTATAGV